jgi:hypothetical protein
MYARATTYRGSPEDVQEAIAHWEEGVRSIREFLGSRGGFLLVDRQQAQGSGLRSGRALDRCEQAASGRMSFGSRLKSQSASR